MTGDAAGGAPHRPATAQGRPVHAVVVAMKPQLRGRIRRNVTTLLELGARVTVVSVPSRKDFFVGLDHPRLEAHFLRPRSSYVALGEYVAHRAERRGQRTARRRAGHATARLAGVAPQPEAAGGPQAAAGRTPWSSRFPVPSRLRRPVSALRRGVRVVHRALRRSGVLHRRLRRQALDIRRSVFRAGRSVERGAIRMLRRAVLPTHRITRFLAFWRDSADFVEQLAPDLVVSSDLPGLVGASVAAHRLGRPHLHDCHELYLESGSLTRLERRILTPVERTYMRRADSVVVVNQVIADEYTRRYGVPTRVVRNCAPAVGEALEVTDIRQAAALPQDSVVVLYQGGYAEGRGLDVCLRAAREFPEGVHLVMLGYGPLEGEIRTSIDDWGLHDRVHLLDAVPPGELAGYTVSADVGLIPYQPVTRNNLYALPNKVFEYTGAGVPVLASDLPELRRVAVDAGCGAVYDPYDHHSLATALVAMLEPAAYARHRDAARRFGLANTWENERKILVSEIVRLAPALGEPTSAEASPGTRSSPSTATTPRPV